MTSIKKVNRNSDFVKTLSLRKYRDSRNMSNADVAELIGRSVGSGTVSYWCVKGTVPRWVVQELGLKTRGGPRTDKAATTATGEIYISYVDRNKEAVFKAFCTAMKINVKTVL